MAEPKRRGRPPKPAAQVKRANLTFRTRDELREMLVESAKRSQRSLSEEVEYRLEQSMSGEEALLDNLGGPNTKRVLRPLLIFFELLHMREKDWVTDGEVAKTLGDSIKLIVDAVASGYRPPKTDIAELKQKGGSTLEALEVLRLILQTPNIVEQKDPDD